MRRENGRCYFYQWELDQRIVVPENCTMVHFANGTQEKALSSEVFVENGVRLAKVPNILLQTAAVLNAYAWDNQSTSVIEHTAFDVFTREKPGDYAYTETEVKNYGLLEEQLQEASEEIKRIKETGKEQGNLLTQILEKLKSVAGIETALGSKLEKATATGKKLLYGIDKAGNQVMYEVASGAYGNTIVLRNGTGQLTVSTPTADLHAANKKYVDKMVAEAKAAADRHCPEFTESGAVVTCEPAEGYPLAVVSGIAPVQDGTPSPQSPCPITGHTAVTLTLSNGEESGEHTYELGQTVYCGNFNWATGELTITHKMLTLTGDESNWQKYSTGTIMNSALLGDAKKGTASVIGVSSHVATNADGVLNWDFIRKMNANSGYETSAAKWGLPDNEVATWTAFLKAQQDAGTPVQIVYELETPITVGVVADPQEILALPYENRLYSDTGDTTVTGRVEPVVMFAKMEERIAALEAAVSNT